MLKELLDNGYVEVRARLGRPAPAAAVSRRRKAARLALELAHLQTKRFARAFERSAPGAYDRGLPILLER